MECESFAMLKLMELDGSNLTQEDVMDLYPRQLLTFVKRSKRFVFEEQIDSAQ